MKSCHVSVDTVLR